MGECPGESIAREATEQGWVRVVAVNGCGGAENRHQFLFSLVNVLSSQQKCRLPPDSTPFPGRTPNVRGARYPFPGVRLAALARRAEPIRGVRAACAFRERFHQTEFVQNSRPRP